MNAKFRAHGPSEKTIESLIEFVNYDEGARVFIQDGVHVNERTGNVMSTKLLALMLHYGADNIPARPFMTDFLAFNSDACYGVLRNSMRIQSSKEALQKGKLRIYVDYAYAGHKIAALLRLFMVTYYREAVPNAPLTIMNKGSDIPLLESGQLFRSVANKVIKGVAR